MPSARPLVGSARPLVGSALPWVLAVIVLVEIGASLGFGERFANHGVDVLLRRLSHEHGEARLILTGDSVGAQVLPGVLPPQPGVRILATNAATEMAGPYYTLRRYLARAQRPPKQLVMLAHPPLGANLHGPLTENYVQRCFTQWDEIWELGIATRNPVFVAKQLAYKALTTLRFRLRLQEALTGIANADARGGVAPATASSAQASTGHGIVQMADAWLRSRRARPISDEYLDRMLDLCTELGIEVHYIPAPLSQSLRRSGRTLEAWGRMKKLARAHPGYHYVATLERVYPDDRFVDGVHFRDEALEQYRRELRPVIEQISRLGER